MTIPNEKNEVGKQNIQITSDDFEKIKGWGIWGNFYSHRFSLNMGVFFGGGGDMAKPL